MGAIARVLSNGIAKRLERQSPTIRSNDETAAMSISRSPNGCSAVGRAITREPGVVTIATIAPNGKS